MNLETVTGRLVDVINPDPSTIDITDIAWALSRMPRFAGHTISIIPYNVASHSIFVAETVKRLLNEINFFKDWYKEYPGVPVNTLIDLNDFLDKSSATNSGETDLVLKALLHDAAEAFTGDIPSPVKQHPDLKQVIKGIENNLMLAIYEIVGVQPPTDLENYIIKFADKIAQKIEAHAFMTSRGKDWVGLPNVSIEELQKFNEPVNSLESYHAFLSLYKELVK